MSKPNQKKSLKSRKRRKDFEKRREQFKTEKRQIENGTRKKFSVQFPKSKKIKDKKPDIKVTIVE